MNSRDALPPRQPPVRLIALLLLALCLGVGALALLSESRADSNAMTVGGPFSLTASDGRTVTDRDFHGRYLLVYFGYTSCPDVCPLTMAELATALKQLGDRAAAVQPLFITVDPARDTPAVLQSYLVAFSPRLLGLTGTPAQLTAVEKEYRAVAQIHRSGPDTGDYSVDHSSIFYLMGPDGKFISLIRADQPGADLAAAIAPYLAATPPGVPPHA